MADTGFPLRSPVHENRLSNGLRLLVCEDRRAPVVAIVTHVRAGYFDESDEEVGISHVLEHMFFKGTDRRGPGDMARETKALGGYLNAGTIYDRTSYYTVVPASGLAEALDIQADALIHSVIDTDELERELRVIIQEAKRKLDSPAAVAHETLFETMFDRHRIRRWRIGTEEGLSRLGREDVVRFYRNRYTASDIVLCIAGDVDAAAVFAQVERHYGGMPPTAVPRERGPDEPARTGFRFRETRGDIQQTHLEWGWHSPGTLHPDTPVLDVLALVLGQGRASRLFRGVREAGLVTRISASDYTPGDIGIFGIEAVCMPDDAHAALDATYAEVEALRADGVRDAEVERARNVLEARMIRRFETVEGQAATLAEWQALGDWRLLEHYWSRVMSVSADDLGAAARHYLDGACATVLVYAPDKAPAVTWQPGPAAGPARSHAATVDTAGPASTVHRRTVSGRSDDGARFFESDGVHIVVASRREVPLVSLAYALAGGASEEDAARAGLTALMARTTVKGTRGRTAAQLAEAVEALGGAVSPGVGPDALEWSLTVPSRHLERGLDLLTDVALNASFPEVELERERKAALSEIDLLRDDMHRYPHRLFFEAAFEGDAYGLPLVAAEAMLRETATPAVTAWHDHVVRARPSTLLIVGDVDADSVAALAAGFAAGQRPALPPEPESAAWPRVSKQNVAERDTAQTALVLGYPGPPRNHPDVDALRVLAAAVAGLGGPLFEELRSRRTLAYAVSTSMIARRRAGAFVAYIGTSPEREDEARAGLIEQLGRLREELLEEAEIERTRRYMIGTRQIRLQTNGAVLGELAGALLLGSGLAELREWEARIHAVTAERIRDAAATWFDDTRIVEGVVRGRGRGR